MSQHEQLIENYEDALFKLLMEAVIEHEGKQIQEEIERLNSDPSFSVPPELDRRCIRTINKIARRKRMSHTGKKLYRIFSKFSVAAVIALALFTSAYAAFPEVRVSTLNLLIEVSDIATEFRFTEDINDAEPEPQADQTPEVNMTLADYELPTYITSNYQLTDGGDSEFSSWALFTNSDGASVYIDVQAGHNNSVSINTEDAVSIRELNVNQFEGIVAEQNEMVLAGIADLDKTCFILFAFEGIEFTSAVAIATEFMNVN